MIKSFLTLLCAMILSSCSCLEETPQGIGPDMDALKKSACPCGEVFYRNGKTIN